MALSALGIVLVILGIFATLTQFLSFFGPVCLFRRIIQQRSTLNSSGIPFPFGLFSSLFYVWYGLPLVSEHNLLMAIINSIGAIFQLIYIFIFVLYAPHREKTQILLLLSMLGLVFTVVTLMSRFHEEKRRIVCGYFAVISSIGAHAVLIPMMRVVIITRNTESMSLIWSLLLFLYSTAWLTYGAIRIDPFIIVSNAFGSIIGGVQIILYFKYRRINQEAPFAVPVSSPPVASPTRQTVPVLAQTPVAMPPPVVAPVRSPPALVPVSSPPTSSPAKSPPSPATTPVSSPPAPIRVSSLPAKSPAEGDGGDSDSAGDFIVQLDDLNNKIIKV